MGPYEPGLFLRLYHGRKSPDEEMQQWGPDGPTFGPLKYVHAAYLSTMQIGFLDGKSWEKLGPGLEKQLFNGVRSRAAFSMKESAAVANLAGLSGMLSLGGRPHGTTRPRLGRS